MHFKLTTIPLSNKANTFNGPFLNSVGDDVPHTVTTILKMIFATRPMTLFIFFRVMSQKQSIMTSPH